ncbi:MAG: FtsW/RodA/SpoVE family cell cycle protein [Oscillospiraceae bacterium]|nr:FtsW/RodA/SpoVE family cell cycle protein [Oscillospiraceae bacterium]
MTSNKSTFACLAVLTASLILCIRPTITSTYAQHEGPLTAFLGTSLLLLVLTMLRCRKLNCTYAHFGMTTAALLMTGTASSLPLLYYTSAYDTAMIEQYAKEITISIGVSLLCIFLTWALIPFLEHLLQSFPKLCSFVFSEAMFLLAAVILACSDASANTTIVFGVQIALPAMAMLVIGTAAAFRMESGVGKCMTALGCAACAGALIIRNETGIPLLFYAALLIWYALFCKKKHRILNIALPVLPMAGFGVLYLWHCISAYLPQVLQSNFLSQLSHKIVGRLLTQEVEQSANALKSIQHGGWFGSSTYDVYVSEASSDFALSTILHYCGGAFLILLLTAALPFFWMGASHHCRTRNRFSDMLSSLSFVVFAVMLFYNLLMVLGIFPILGVQAPFTGSSVLCSALSGFLLGAAIYPQELAEKIQLQMKGEFQ